ncbi:hypothetical protein [Aquabacterium sp.]|uniref:hypothetical protein n=1 Tax=Aquabacterium sp. TaxID=1872578 RepID=UPI0019869525|nr:hypothetical protein [Aquabacterium sp.]MBC7699305.1 hypothetical protein [Aquabacterium sp.]
MQTLKSEGLLPVVANARGGAPGSTPQHHLHLDRISTWTDLTAMEFMTRARQD